jgi:hypothetical protein
MCPLDLLVPRPDESMMNFEGVCVSLEISSPDGSELRKGAYSDVRIYGTLGSSAR